MSSKVNTIVLLAAATVGTVFAVNAAGDSNPGIAGHEVIASVPRSMTYQGILKNSAGDPVTDSVYSVTFRIFDAESGGPSLWDETLPCTTSAGLFDAVFSDVNLPFNVDYWLELEISSEILTPRQKLNMSAYAARADTSDYALSAFNASGWVDDGTTVRLESDTDNVGIGTTSPSYKLDVHGTVGIDVDSNFADVPLTLSVPSNHSALISRIAKGGTIINVVDSIGNVGIGTFSPSSKLDVNGDMYGRSNLLVDGNASIGGDVYAHKANVSQFQLILGASSGYVLTSDGSGNGTWQAASADSDWTISSPDIYSAVSGNVGIGTPSPDYKLDVRGTMGVDVGPFSGDIPFTINVPYDHSALISRIAKGGNVINVVDNNGNVGIGTFIPSAKLEVNGNMLVNGNASFGGDIDANKSTVSYFRMPLGASSGYVLTSDGSGNGTWQALPSAIHSNSKSIERIDTKIEELIGIIESQSETIAQLENRIAEMEGEVE